MYFMGVAAGSCRWTYKTFSRFQDNLASSNWSKQGASWSRGPLQRHWCRLIIVYQIYRGRAIFKRSSLLSAVQKSFFLLVFLFLCLDCLGRNIFPSRVLLFSKALSFFLILGVAKGKEEMGVLSYDDMLVYLLIIHIAGQMKLGVHAMRLCQISGGSNSNDNIKSHVLESLLRLLDGHIAFNNVFLRHHLFCIIQILAGR